MPRSDLARPMSRLEGMARKNGNVAGTSGSSAREPLPEERNLAIELPKPNQPGSMMRHWLQLNTHGMARRSPRFCEGLRDAGRLPMFRLTISEKGVAARK